MKRGENTILHQHEHNIFKLLMTTFYYNVSRFTVGLFIVVNLV